MMPLMPGQIRASAVPVQKVYKDLLTYDFGDAGGLKTYHDGLGVLRNNTHQLLENANMNDVASSLPSGWGNLIDVGVKTYEDKGGYQEATITADANRPALVNQCSTVAGQIYTVGFYWVSTTITDSVNIARIAGETVNSSITGAAFTTEGWYAMGVQAADTTIAVTIGPGSSASDSGTIVFNRPFVVSGLLPGVTLGGSARLTDTPAWIGTNDGDEPVYHYRKAAHYLSGSTWLVGGFLTEPQGTNEIRNNTMVGAVAGDPGTTPTNWVVDGDENGLEREVIGVGTADGIEYIDIKWSGTTTGAGTLRIKAEGTQQIAAVQGETWTLSTYIALVAGTETGLGTTKLQISEYDNAAAIGTSHASADIGAMPTDLKAGRQEFTATLADVDAAFIEPHAVVITYSTTTAIDFTLRIGLPQCEENNHATSVIKTYTAAVTRVADTASISFPTFDATQGTFIWSVVSNSPFDGTRWVMRLKSADTTNSVGVYLDGSGLARLHYKVTGSSDDEAATGALTQGVRSNMAHSYDNSASRGSRDGNAAAGSRALAGPPVGISEYYIGYTPSTQHFSGFIPRLDYYPLALADADLERLSA